MKESPIFFIFLFSILFLNAQEKEKTKVILQDNLFGINLSYATELSEKWVLRSKLGVSSINYNNSIDFFPVSIEYHITKKWKVFGEPKLRINLNNNLGTLSNFEMSTQVGTRYDFTKHLYGELLFNTPILQKRFKQQKFIPEGQLYQSPFTVHMGFKF